MRKRGKRVGKKSENVQNVGDKTKMKREKEREKGEEREKSFKEDGQKRMVDRERAGYLTWPRSQRRRRRDPRKLDNFDVTSAKQLSRSTSSDVAENQLGGPKVQAGETDGERSVSRSRGKVEISAGHRDGESRGATERKTAFLLCNLRTLELSES